MVNTRVIKVAAAAVGFLITEAVFEEPGCALAEQSTSDVDSKVSTAPSVVAPSNSWTPAAKTSSHAQRTPLPSTAPLSTAQQARILQIESMKSRTDVPAMDAYAVAHAYVSLKEEAKAAEYFEIAINSIHNATLPHSAKFTRQVASEYARLLRKTDPEKAKKLKQEFCAKR